MAKKQKHEYSSEELASLASKVLRQETATQAAKRLAGSVLTQARNKKK